MAVASACAGHEGGQGQDNGQDDGQDDETTVPVNAEDQGHWQWNGYVCDNAGICNSRLLCPDGSIKMEYIFVNPDGSLGDTQQLCPGDPAIPEESKTPPTPGEIFTAFKKVAPTKAVLAVQPPDGQTLVNFETIFSTVADPFTTPKIDLVPGFTVEFEIFPKSFTWKFGDGAELATDWAGKPWAQGVDVSTLINHVYTTTRDVNASVTTTWGARARINGGPPQAVNGTVGVTSPDVSLEILEAKPTLVR